MPDHVWSEVESDAHYHTDSRGYLHRCYHVCKNRIPWLWVTIGWLAGQTLTFPLEHLLWERVWGFRTITQWMGL